MIITVGGSVGSGKTTLAKELSRRFRLKHISAGEVMREMASKRNMTLLEFSKYAEQHPEVDCEIDETQKKLASSSKGGCVVEGRISAHVIKKVDLKVWLTAPLEIRAKRIMGREKDKYRTVSKAAAAIKKREDSERKRYKRFYGIDLNDLSFCDLVLNTGKWGATEMADVVSKALEKIKRQS